MPPTNLSDVSRSDATPSPPAGDRPASPAVASASGALGAVYAAVFFGIDAFDPASLWPVLRTVLDAAAHRLAQQKANDEAIDHEIACGASVEEAVDRIDTIPRGDALEDAVATAVDAEEVQAHLGALAETVATVLHYVSDAAVATICPCCSGPR